MSNPDRETEKRLLDKWFETVSFDKTFDKLPEVKPEPGDDD